MSDITGFYRRPGPISDLGRHSRLVRDLPGDAEALGAIVRGLLVHNFDVKTRDLQFSAARMAHMQTASAGAILDNVIGLDPSPIDVKRPVERRMVGFCYHFALLHCALLRATGTSARARCGFAGYFVPGYWIGHWVTEYWDGPTARNQARSGASASAVYGNGELWGWDELRGSLINDVGALSKVEVASWYWCERIKVEPLDQPHNDIGASLDLLARCTAAADSAEEIRACFDLYPELQPPPDAVVC